MKLKFIGANRQVTGSRHYLEADGTKLLVDCGMYQERRFLDRNWEPFPVDPGSLDAVLVTHAHLDHCGMLPRLVAAGFSGPIFATAASADLIEIILRDSAHIQEEDAEYKKRRHRKEGRRGKHPEVPLYTAADVERTLSRIEPVGYGNAVKINEHSTVTFHDAGHILGSAVLDLAVNSDGQFRRVLFSGDLGQKDKPIIRDPVVFDSADYIVLESTYGDRDHEPPADVESQLADVIGRTLSGGGNVVIPVFAVERAQELMYHISRLVRNERIPNVPIFLDSPMAIDVTDVFRRHRECFDDESWALINSGEPPLRFPGLTMSSTVEQSKSINDLASPKIIMATSGMCTAGRIKFHLKQNIKRPESTILFVGFQVPGTLGRQILDGKQEVRIHGHNWLVKAQVAQVRGFSGHADRGGLIRWLAGLKSPPRKLFLVHGDENASLALAEQVAGELGYDVTVPNYLDEVRVD